MNQFLKLIVLLSSLLCLCLSCASKENMDYIQFKTIVKADGVADLGFMHAYLNVDDSAKKVIDAYVCESYVYFKDLYGIYRDSILIDSIVFNDYKLKCFEFRTTNGDSLGSYDFKIKSDTLFINQSS